MGLLLASDSRGAFRARRGERLQLDAASLDWIILFLKLHAVLPSLGFNKFRLVGRRIRSDS